MVSERLKLKHYQIFIENIRHGGGLQLLDKPGSKQKKMTIQEKFQFL